MDELELPADSDSDSEQDSDRQHTREQLDSARATAKVLNGIAWPLFLWSLIAPRAYQVLLVALALLPLIAIVLLVRSNGLYVLSGIRGGPRADLGPAFLGCALILFVRAIRDINILPLQWIAVLIAATIRGMHSNDYHRVGRSGHP